MQMGNTDITILEGTKGREEGELCPTLGGGGVAGRF